MQKVSFPLLLGLRILYDAVLCSQTLGGNSDECLESSLT
jgi:hypothetical protein